MDKIPFYAISIDGADLGDDILSLIENVSFEETSSGSDLLTISLNDPNFQFIEDDIFIEDKPITFICGYLDETPIEFNGYISAIDIIFPDSGSPVLTMHCMDGTHLMNRKKKKRTWNNMKKSDVVAEIVKEYGFQAIVDDTEEVMETISQTDVTDIQFIESLSGDLPDIYLVYLEGEDFHFVRKKVLDEPQKVLNYRKAPFNIFSFDPQINKENKPMEVEKSDINDSTKEVETALATDDMDREVSGSPVRTTDTKTPTRTLDVSTREWVSNQ